MNILKPELCSNCERRSLVSRIIAKQLLGSDYVAEGCPGLIVGESSSTTENHLGGLIPLTLHYVEVNCGKPELTPDAKS